MSRFQSLVFAILITFSSFIESIEKKNIGTIKYYVASCCVSAIIGGLIGYRIYPMVKQTSNIIDLLSNFKSDLSDAILVFRDFSDNEYLKDLPQSDAEAQSNRIARTLDISLEKHKTQSNNGNQKNNDPKTLDFDEVE